MALFQIGPSSGAAQPACLFKQLLASHTKLSLDPELRGLFPILCSHPSPFSCLLSWWVMVQQQACIPAHLECQVQTLERACSAPRLYPYCHWESHLTARGVTPSTISQHDCFFRSTCSLQTLSHPLFPLRRNRGFLGRGQRMKNGRGRAGMGGGPRAHVPKCRFSKWWFWNVWNSNIFIII